ncbi:uncharacterized protein C3orf38-like [Dendropsophus ebraccatus]|uniref:uncharacterized protein C3orf38-like n=1 Tax=Dendropsophus ebraccatus TaxID=150705 RepID=UPI00383115EA
MGLSTRERTGGRRLLELLNLADLFSLAGTVIKKKSTVYTKTGAIDTILEHSLSAYELLNRKKVLRDTIITYLKSEGVSMQPSITKADVIQKTLAHWSEPSFSVLDIRPFTPSSVTPGFNFPHPLYII